MCSGVLFLRPDKSVSLRAVWGKYIPKILLCLGVWAVLYEGFDLLRRAYSGGVGWIDVTAAAKRLLTFNTHFHLYYLYIVLLVYALVPLLRDLLAVLSPRRMGYLLALWATVGLVFPFLRQFYPFTQLTGIPLQYPLNMTWSAAGYCILGHVLATHPLRRHWALLLSGTGFVCIFCGTAWLSLSRGALSGVFFEGMTPAVAMLAAGIFSLCCSLTPGRSFAAVTRYLSRASFCIYLSHDFFNIILRHFGFTTAVIHPILSAPMSVALVLLGSLGIHLLLSHLPWVKKWLI